MGLLQRLEMRQGQSLVMTPQLLQAIKLLQLSHLDLAGYVEAELERNPLLETAEPDRAEAAPPGLDALLPEPARHGETEIEFAHGHIDERAPASLDNVFPDDAPVASQPGPEDHVTLSSSAWQSSGPGSEREPGDVAGSLKVEPSLWEHLGAQLDLAVTDPLDRLVGRHLIDAVDEAGYLTEGCDTVADLLGARLPDVERVLDVIQTFSPSGIAARNLAECLAIQLRELDRFDPAMQALVARLDLVAKRDTAQLKRLCRVDDEDLADMLAEVRRLDPKPGRAFGGAPLQVLVPDVLVRPAADGGWLVELNPDTLPRVLVNQAYHVTVSRQARSDAERSFISECLQSANWLTRSLEQRSRTILKVATEIVRQQDAFFAHGVRHLRPLNLKTIADAIGMHESTVSRVTSNKAIGTARGTFEMRYFFTAAIAASSGGEAHSSEAVRYRIKQMIDAETPADILSDDALVKRLRDDGVDIARRTVAKYREALRIPSSVDRRRDKRAGL